MPEKKKTSVTENIDSIFKSILKHVWVVVLAGGGGTRLFPLSNEYRPKPFVSITGELTLIQETVERFRKFGIASRHMIVITTNEQQTVLAREQLETLYGIPSQNFHQISPTYGYTGAMVAAARYIVGFDEKAILINTPADQCIESNDSFINAVKNCVVKASRSLFAVVAVKMYDLVTVMGSGHVLYAKSGEVLKFIEKPNKALANKLILEDTTACNTGINVWKAEDLLREVKDHDFEEKQLPTDEFMKLFMRNRKLFAVLCECIWFDLGTYDAVYRYNLPRATPRHRNVSVGNVKRVGCRSSYLNAAKGHRILAYNIREGAVIATYINGIPVLLCFDLVSSQDVRIFAAEFERTRQITRSPKCCNVVWTEISDECVIGVVGPKTDVVAKEIEMPNGDHIIEWTVSRPPQAA